MLLFYFQTDFLLIILRDMLKTFPNLRIILMSATIDTSVFSRYFGSCPVIELEGRIHPVQGNLKVNFPIWLQEWRAGTGKFKRLKENSYLSLLFFSYFNFPRRSLIIGFT